MEGRCTLAVSDPLVATIAIVAAANNRQQWRSAAPCKHCQDCYGWTL